MRVLGRVALQLPLLFLVSCRVHDFPDYPARYREFAYITNSRSDTVAVLDLVNLRVDHTVRVGSRPTGVAASPRRNEIYVVNTGSSSVTVINAETNQPAATIAVRREPYDISVDSAGTRAYVANSASNSVSVIDLAARRVIATVGVGERPGLARVAPDGGAIVVSNREGNSASVVDASTLKVRAVFDNCPGATDIAILPDSSRAFVACSGGHQVMAIALAHESAPDQFLALLDVGTTPTSLAMKPDGGEIFVTNFGSNSISEIVTNSAEVGGTYPIGIHPSRGLVSADNSLLYVSNFGSDSVAVYSIDDGRYAGEMRTGNEPDALAFSSAGHLLLAVDSGSGDVALLRTHARTLFTMLPAGAAPAGIAIKSFLMRR